jgi:thioredoxin-related protein
MSQLAARIVFGTLLLTAFSMLLISVSVRAAVEPHGGEASASRLQLVVVEAQGCIYCRIFRRDVLPLYRTSARANVMPMRFSDVNDVEEGKLKLVAPIDNVPTVLLIEDAREVGRVSGYVGPENFFHSLDRLIRDAGAK